MRMKVCLLSYRGNPYCGGQAYTMYVARELVKLGLSMRLSARRIRLKWTAWFCTASAIIIISM